MQTYSYKFVDFNYENNFRNYSSFKVRDLSNYNNLSRLYSVLDELSQTWYTAPKDFVSAHRDNPVSVSHSFTSVYGQNDLKFTVSNDVDDVSDPLPSVGTGDSLINNLMLQSIERVSRFVNKDSVIGSKLNDWVKVHYGTTVANSLFKVSNNIASWRLNADITDVFSTADTASPDGGELLGAYAGKGIGYDKASFKYDCREWGFVFILSSVVPDAGFCQGVDPTLYMIDRDTIPFVEYDALGYEVTPANCLLPSNDISYTDNPKALTDNDHFSDHSKNYSGVGFGFVPRYSSFKFKKNVVNGDMSRRGSVDSYSAYYLDRLINSNIVQGDSNADKSIDFSFDSTSVPYASEEWRYITKYPYIGAFNRIFYQSGSLLKGAGTQSWWQSDELIDDNFICQSVFDFKV